MRKRLRCMRKRLRFSCLRFHASASVCVLMSYEPISHSHARSMFLYSSTVNAVPEGRCLYLLSKVFVISHPDNHHRKGKFAEIICKHS